MAKWNVELCCGIGFTVSGIEAQTKGEAVSKAKSLVLNTTTVITGSQVEEGSLEYESTTFVQKEE